MLWGGTRGYGVRARGYDRCYGVEPEDMVSELEDMTGVMGWSQRSREYGVRARGYDRSYGVEPEAMV